MPRSAPGRQAPPIPTNELRQRAAEPVILDAKVGNYAIVAKIMKTSLPDNAKIAREAKECMQECVSEYISFITSEASDKCSAEKRKTVNGEDIIFAMQSLGFENYAEAAKVYLTKYRESQQQKSETQAVARSSTNPRSTSHPNTTNPAPTPIPTTATTISAGGANLTHALASSSGAHTLPPGSATYGSLQSPGSDMLGPGSAGGSSGARGGGGDGGVVDYAYLTSPGVGSTGQGGGGGSGMGGY